MSERTIPREPERESTPQEWAWVAVKAALIAITPTAAYLGGYFAQTPESRFVRIILDKMWQGYHGHWRYHLLFTPEDHNGVYFQMSSIALGHLARVISSGWPAVYHAAHVRPDSFVLLTIYRFIASFVSSVRTRLTAFSLVTVAPRPGWMRENIAPTLPREHLSDQLLALGHLHLSVLADVPALLSGLHAAADDLPVPLGLFKGPPAKEGILTVVSSLMLGLVLPHLSLVAALIYVTYCPIPTPGIRWPSRGLLAMGGMSLVQLPLLFYDL